MSKHFDDVYAPIAQMEGRMAHAEVFGRRPVPAPTMRNVPVFYPRGGKIVRRDIVCGRPVPFDEMMVAVYEDVTDDVPIQLKTWDRFHPESPRAVARDLLKDARRARAALGPPLRSDKFLFDARYSDPNNMAHLILNILPYCLYVQQTLGAENTLSVFVEIEGPFREILSHFDLRFIESSRRLGGRLAHVRAMRGFSPHDLPKTLDLAATEMCNFVFDSFEFDSPKVMEKIFLARRGMRSLANQTEVEAFLRGRGYEVYYPEDYTTYEQLAIGKHAKHIVGVHGAGLGPIVLNRNLASFVELAAPHVPKPYYFNALTDLAGSMSQVVSSLDDRLVHAGYGVISQFQNLSFPIHIEALEAALDAAGG